MERKDNTLLMLHAARSIFRSCLHLGLSVTALAAVLSHGTQAQATTPFPLGGYFNDPDNSNASAESTFETNYNSFTQLMNTSPQFLVRYIDQDHEISQWVGDASWAASSQQQSPAKNAIPVIGFPTASKASDAPPFDQQFKSFASGQYDATIQSIVQTWQQNGYKTQYWRVGWEMNINTSGSSAYAGQDTATEADWVAAFQHIATVLRQAGNTYGVTIKIVWNPNVTNYDQTNTLSNLYPGDSYVDIIAADIYGNIYPYGIPSNPNLFWDWDKNDGTVDTLAQFIADPVNRVHYWTYPAATQYSLDGSNGHNLSLQVLLNFAKTHAKPFAVPETGAGRNGSLKPFKLRATPSPLSTFGIPTPTATTCSPYLAPTNPAKPQPGHKASGPQPFLLLLGTTS